jgi:flagellar P-ring protein precursor FlgI
MRDENMKKKLVIQCLILLFAAAVQAERIKDIVDIQGVRSNTLEGVGLVVGLADTGDSSLPSQRLLTNILRRSGLVFSANDMKSENIAMVIVTAQLGPFAREGSRLDVDVASVGDAKSLSGGKLLMTELYGADGQVYAVAAGSVFIGGWSVSGTQSSMSKGHSTVARIPDGAVVERAEISKFVEQLGTRRFVTLSLRNNDFMTAERISQAINSLFVESSIAIDAGTIKVEVPEVVTQAGLSAFLVDIMKPEVVVDIPAVVVINERTGTIVVGENVGISEVAISHGTLVVKVKEQKNVSQPNTPFTEGATTEITPETLLDVEEPGGALVRVRGVTVSELAKSLNAIGASPTDLIAIFNALKRAGALQARIEIM